MRITFNPIVFWATIAQLVLKLFAGWAAFTFVTWMGAPEWMVITLTVMAVASARIEVTETRG